MIPYLMTFKDNALLCACDLPLTYDQPAAGWIALLKSQISTFLLLNAVCYKWKNLHASFLIPYFAGKG